VLLMFQGVGQGLNLSMAPSVFTAERVLHDCSVPTDRLKSFINNLIE